MRDACSIIYSNSIVDDYRSVIDDSRVTVQLVASYTIVIYDDHVFIAQAIVRTLLHLNSENC